MAAVISGDARHDARRVSRHYRRYVGYLMRDHHAGAYSRCLRTRPPPRLRVGSVSFRLFWRHDDGSAAAYRRGRLSDYRLLGMMYYFAPEAVELLGLISLTPVYRPFRRFLGMIGPVSTTRHFIYAP